jgi:hypothetical protein
MNRHNVTKWCRESLGKCLTTMMRCKKESWSSSKYRRQNSMTRGYRRWFQHLINVWAIPSNMLKNRVMYRQFIHSVAFINYNCCKCLRPLYLYFPDTPHTSAMSAPISVELLHCICYSLNNHVGRNKLCQWPGLIQVFFPSYGGRKQDYSPHVQFPDFKPIVMLAVQVATLWTYSEHFYWLQ